mmetsp:Transcript_73848/g.225858  ORF Transcript_73848/g.225858 Transcript_73848/m.225858 type:complete len:298 (-) Transcript_73848:290-1183(-)
MELVEQVGVVPQRLTEDLLTKRRDVDLAPLELEVQGVEGLPYRFVLRAVELLHVGVHQRLVDADAALWVPAHGHGEDLLGERGHVLEDLPERLAGRPRQGLDELPALAVWYLHELLPVGGPEEADDQVQLLLRVVPRVQGLAHVHLGEDAADRPDVDGARVVGPGAQHLGRPVPPRADVLRHRAHPALVGEAHARQAEVADLQVAIAVDEQIARLQVPVDDLRRVHVLHAPQDLVQEELAVVVRERLGRPQRRGQVGLHQLRDDVDLLELRLLAGDEDVLDLHEVLVLQVPQDPKLP